MNHNLAGVIATLRHALPYCYEAADQTVQCPECNSCWWDVPEAIDEDWHAPGCALLAARVAIGVSKPVRRRAEGEPSAPYHPNEARPESRTPAMILRDTILDGWFRRLAAMKYVSPLDGVDGPTWERAVSAVIDRLLDACGPYRGPYSLDDVESPADVDEAIEMLKATRAAYRREVDRQRAILAGSTVPPDDTVIRAHGEAGGRWYVAAGIGWDGGAGTAKALEYAAEHREYIARNPEAHARRPWRWFAYNSKSEPCLPPEVKP